MVGRKGHCRIADASPFRRVGIGNRKAKHLKNRNPGNFHTGLKSMTVGKVSDARYKSLPTLVPILVCSDRRIEWTGDQLRTEEVPEIRHITHGIRRPVALPGDRFV